MATNTTLEQQPKINFLGFGIFFIMILAAFVYWHYSEIEIDRKAQYLEVHSAQEKVYSFLNAPVAHSFDDIPVKMALETAIKDVGENYVIDYQASTEPTVTFESNNSIETLFRIIINNTTLSIEVDADKRVIHVRDGEGGKNIFTIHATNTFYYKPNPYGFTDADL